MKKQADATKFELQPCNSKEELETHICDYNQVLVETNRQKKALESQVHMNNQIDQENL